MEQNADSLICRTCLTLNLPLSKYILITSFSKINSVLIKDMLETFVPEMDLDISHEEVRICEVCLHSLEIAYSFKNKCLNTEQQIYDYLDKNNLHLGKKIHLSNIAVNSANLHYPEDLKANSEEKEENIINNLIELDNSFSDSNESNLQVINLDSESSGSANVEKSEGISKSDLLKRSFSCNQCEYKAYRRDLLEFHKKKHERNILEPKEFKCDLCMYTTVRKRALHRHKFTHKGKSQHSCNVCNKHFAEKHQLKLHLLTHSGEELPHKCNDCGKTFLTQSYLKSHLEVRHLSFPRYYKCDKCESSFSDKRGLDAHKFSHTGGQFPFRCHHCDFGSAWKRNLKKHLETKH